MGFNVIDIFTSLDMLQWEREKIFQWDDLLDNVLSDEMIEIITNDYCADVESLT